MTDYNQPQPQVAYPPPQPPATHTAPPPPAGYPTRDPDNLAAAAATASAPVKTQYREDGFWRGCCEALCCCCAVETICCCF